MMSKPLVNFLYWPVNLKKLLNSLIKYGISQLFISLVFLGSIPIPSVEMICLGYSCFSLHNEHLDYFENMLLFFSVSKIVLRRLMCNSITKLAIYQDTIEKD
jgi:NhaP-type Na+/H+ or K+/H+ antiporter